MIPLAPELALIVALASTPVPPTPPDLPVLEVVKVYGKLAGPQCYGMKAPPGSSCQIQLSDLPKALQLDDNSGGKLSRDDFASRLAAMDFQWPLKPYGIEKSNRKTAVMNKGAETRVFLDELEARGLYDRRNPTGPLPTSLRPALNKKLQEEGLDPRAIDLVFQAFAGGTGEVSADQIQRLFHDQTELDYYDFLKLIGTESELWPNKVHLALFSVYSVYDDSSSSPSQSCHPKGRTQKVTLEAWAYYWEGTKPSGFVRGCPLAIGGGLFSFLPRKSSLVETQHYKIICVLVASLLSLKYLVLESLTQCKKSRKEILLF